MCKIALQRITASVFLIVAIFLVSGCDQILSPVAILTSSVDNPYVPVTADLDGSSSFDLFGTIARYRWDFGDGSVKENGREKERHVYTRPGTYTVTLTVYDDHQNSGSDTANIIVRELNISGTWVGTGTPEDGGPFYVEMNLTHTGSHLEGTFLWGTNRRPTLRGSIDTVRRLFSLSGCFLDSSLNDEVCVRLEGSVSVEGIALKLEGDYRFDIADSHRRGAWYAYRWGKATELQKKPSKYPLPRDLITQAPKF